MRSVILSVFLLLAVVPVNVSAQEVGRGSFDGDFVCDRDIVRTYELHEVDPGMLKPHQPTAARRAANIILEAGPTLSANPAALGTWNDAVALWETVLTDNVTVTIVGDLEDLGPGILGSTASSLWSASYTFVRDQVVADRAGDESIVASLPNVQQISVDLPPSGFSYDGAIRATRALLSALGNDPEGFDPGGKDATIKFNTDFLTSFDFDPTDGITPGKLDFFAVVVHEIGHALGFGSSVDVVDFCVSNPGSCNNPQAVGPTVMDLFRLNPGAGAANFSTATRILTHGGEVSAQTMYDGLVERRLSTGFFNGDGRQASHWRADELSGATIGIMDPTISSGQMGKLTNSDVRALGLMGWDVAYVADCNNNDIGDQFDIWDGVSDDFNLNGIPDECEGTAAPAFVKAQVLIAPNPFNPRTEIRLTLSEDARTRVNIYDMAGRHIDMLADRDYGVGQHSVIWEGKDAEGRSVSSGVYFVLVDVGGEVQRHKVALVR